MARPEQLKLSESVVSGSNIDKNISVLGDKLNKLQADSERNFEKNFKDILKSTTALFENNPNKWQKEQVKSVHAFVTNLGVLIAQKYGTSVASAYVKDFLKKLFDRVDQKEFTSEDDRVFITTLTQEKENYRFAHYIEASWLGEDGFRKMNAINALISKWGKTISSKKNSQDPLKNFDYIFSNLRDKWLDEYVAQVLDSAPESKKVADADKKIKANFVINFYESVRGNSEIGDAEKRKVLELSESISNQIPGVLDQQRYFAAEKTGEKLEGKKRKGSKVARNEALDERLENLSEIAKTQIGKLSLLSKIAELSMPSEKLNAAKASLADVQAVLLNYYKTDAKGKTPFDLENALIEESKSNSALASLFSESIKFIGKYIEKEKEIPYLDELSIMLHNKSAMSTNRLRQAGFAISVLQREEGNFVESRVTMSRLIETHLLKAKDKLTDEEKTSCRQKAENDTAKQLRGYLASAKQQELFVESFKRDFLNENRRMPTDEETLVANRANVAFLFNTVFAINYDSHLVSASLSSKYMTRDILSNMTPFDKEVYKKFYESVAPDGGLSDENNRTYNNIANFVGELALLYASGGMAVFVGGKALSLIGGISKATKLAQLLNKMPKALQYVRRFTVFSTEVAVEAYTFSEVHTVLGNEVFDREGKTLTELFLEGKTEEAGLKLAAEMPMFAFFKFGHIVCRYFNMTDAGKALFNYALKNPKYKNLVSEVFAAVGSKSPANALARLKNILGREGLPNEIKTVVQESVRHFDGLASKYSELIKNTALDSTSKKVAVWLLRDLQFDALAMFFGEKARSSIADGAEQAQVDANLIDQVIHAYISAGAMGGGLRLGGKLIGRLTLSMKDISYITSTVPAKIRSRVSEALRNTTMAKEGLELGNQEPVRNVSDVMSGRTTLDRFRGTPRWKQVLLEMGVAISAVLSGGKADIKPVEEIEIVAEKLPGLKELSPDSKNVVITAEGGGKVGEASPEVLQKIASTSQKDLVADARAELEQRGGRKEDIALLDAVAKVPEALGVFSPFIKFVPYFTDAGNLAWYTAVDAEGLGKFTENPKNRDALNEMAKKAGLENQVLQASFVGSYIFGVLPTIWLILGAASLLPIVGIVFKPIFSGYTKFLKAAFGFTVKQVAPLAGKAGKFILASEGAKEKITEFAPLDTILNGIGELKRVLAQSELDELDAMYKNMQKEAVKVKYGDQAKAKNLISGVIQRHAIDILAKKFPLLIAAKNAQIANPATPEADKITLRNEVKALNANVEAVEIQKWVNAKDILENRTNVVGLDFSRISALVQEKLNATNLTPTEKAQVSDYIQQLLEAFKNGDPRAVEAVWLILFKPLYDNSRIGIGATVPDRITAPAEFEIYQAKRRFRALYESIQARYDAPPADGGNKFIKAVDYLPNKIPNPTARRIASGALRLALVLGGLVLADAILEPIVDTVGGAILEGIKPDFWKEGEKAFKDAFRSGERRGGSDSDSDSGSHPKKKKNKRRGGRHSAPAEVPKIEQR
ncbi:hypothetical protein M0P48_00970 [Candidatus Gracilibacteria bacterium]|nr:hypothetical protein [Candidatus Gracilibacteria bacterium]